MICLSSIIVFSEDALCNAIDELVDFRTTWNLRSLLCLGMGGSVTKPSEFYPKC